MTPITSLAWHRSRANFFHGLQVDCDDDRPSNFAYELETTEAVQEVTVALPLEDGLRLPIPNYLAGHVDIVGLDLVEQAMRSVTDEDIASVVEDGEELRIGFLDNLSPTTKRRGSRSAETESETLSRLIHALRPLASPRTPRRNSEAWIRARVTDDLEISVRAHPSIN